MLHAVVSLIGIRSKARGGQDLVVFCPAHHTKLEIGGIVAQHIQDGRRNLAGVPGVAVNHDGLIGGQLGQVLWLGDFFPGDVHRARDVPNGVMFRRAHAEDEGVVVRIPIVQVLKQGIGGDDRRFAGTEILVGGSLHHGEITSGLLSHSASYCTEQKHQAGGQYN